MDVVDKRWWKRKACVLTHRQVVGLMGQRTCARFPGETNVGGRLRSRVFLQQQEEVQEG